MIRFKLSSDLSTTKEIIKMIKNVIIATIIPHIIPLLPIFLEEINPEKKEPKMRQIEDIIGIPAMDAPCVSAKTGLNVEEVLERIVTDVPPPNGDPNGKLDPMRYSVSCLKCHHAYWKYRKETGFEELKMKLHLMKVYKG